MMTEWENEDDAPKDGSVFWAAVPYRWVKYKPGSMPRQLAAGGRWQRYNGWGWENTHPPVAWLPAPEPEMPAAFPTPPRPKTSAEPPKLSERK